MILFTPLEQFEIFVVSIVFLPFKYIFLDSFLDWQHSEFITIYCNIACSNVIFSLLSIIILFCFFRDVIFLDTGLVQLVWLRTVYLFITTIKSLFTDLVSTSEGKIYYMVYFISIFIIICSLNVLGLIPYTFVLTSQFFFTFGLAFLFFSTVNLTGVILHGLDFLTLFYPKNTPIFIVPLLILIEFVSYIARVFSLAIRLFANITAGHILVKILSWLTCMVLDFIILSSLSFFLISALWGLEFFISILQAYVFLTLLCLYLLDVLVLH